MRLVRHLSDLPFDALQRGSVVTIGSFDGLHPGHLQLLASVKSKASALGVPAVVMSFEPTPKEFFDTLNPPARLMRFREKYDALSAAGIDLFYCPRFGPTMRDIRADAFIRRLLIHGLNARHIFVGDDFRFGRKREGGIDDLLRVQRALDLNVDRSESVVRSDVRVSSTAIREALAAGDLARATELLGRPYRMSGRVVKGRQIGRTLGFPTANVDLRRRRSPVMGIFAVRISGLGDGSVDGVASVGTRPTFDLVKPLLEVNLFDFDRDIYGEYIHVDFIGHIRKEEKYDSVEELVAQMHEDVENAKLILATTAD